MEYVVRTVEQWCADVANHLESKYEKKKYPKQTAVVKAKSRKKRPRTIDIDKYDKLLETAPKDKIFSFAKYCRLSNCVETTASEYLTEWAIRNGYEVERILRKGTIIRKVEV